MTFTAINLKGHLPHDISWMSILDDFNVQDKEISKYDFGKIISVGEIEIFNEIKGAASCYFDRKDKFYAITLMLVDHNDEFSESEFSKVKNLISEHLGECYLETETSFYQTNYCWNTEYLKLKLWIGCLDRTEINSVSLRIEKYDNI
jgi:hypothetical protein